VKIKNIFLKNYKLIMKEYKKYSGWQPMLQQSCSEFPKKNLEMEMKKEYLR